MTDKFTITISVVHTADEVYSAILDVRGLRT